MDTCYAQADPDMDVSPSLIAAMSTNTKAVTWSMVAEACYADPDMRDLASVIEEGFPAAKSLLKPNLHAFWTLKEDLTSDNGVPMYRGRPVIPAKLRPAVLSVLHAAHQGTTGMQLRAERSVFWPGLTEDLNKVRSACDSCCRTAPSHSRLPPVAPIVPEYPFQHVVMDYMELDGTIYGVFADRYSNWVGVYMGSGGCNTLVTVMKKEFSEHGIPDTCTTDGGPQFIASETQQFFADWGIRHRLTSVANPHANSRAEIAVKTVKRMIRDNVGRSGKLDCDLFYRALMTYRNTPDRDTGLSPAETLCGRPLKDFLPAIPGRTNTRPRETPMLHTWTDLSAHREKALATRATRDHEKWSATSRTLPPLKVGDHVFIQNQSGNYPNRWDKRGVVVEVLQNHQYRVRVDGSRRVTLRNRQFMRRFQAMEAKPFVAESFPASVVLPPVSGAIDTRTTGNGPHATPVTPRATEFYNHADRDTELGNKTTFPQELEMVPHADRSSLARPSEHHGESTYVTTEQTPVAATCYPAKAVQKQIPSEANTSELVLRRSTRLRKPNSRYPDGEYCTATDDTALADQGVGATATSTSRPVSSVG
jgi:hypothetical protein